MIGKTVGHYHIASQIGKGGAGHSCDAGSKLFCNYLQEII
jgi:hypothetical protein